MTIDEAIKVLQEVHRTAEFRWEVNTVAALRLGIEALKRIQFQRALLPSEGNYPLAGETEE